MTPEVVTSLTESRQGAPRLGGQGGSDSLEAASPRESGVRLAPDAALRAVEDRPPVRVMRCIPVG